MARSADGHYMCECGQGERTKPSDSYGCQRCNELNRTFVQQAQNYRHQERQTTPIVGGPRWLHLSDCSRWLSISDFPWKKHKPYREEDDAGEDVGQSMTTIWDRLDGD